jgi:uncharacterized membrane protein
MKSRTKDVALISIWAALYAALVYVFASISFEALQFRVADILPPAIAKKWILAIGYAIGCVVANLVSPFAGPWELIFMPAMSFIAGMLGYFAAKLWSSWDYYICGIVHAVVISLSVAYMLHMLSALPMFETFIPIFVSELILGFIGATLFKLIERRWTWWK